MNLPIALLLILAVSASPAAVNQTPESVIDDVLNSPSPAQAQKMRALIESDSKSPDSAMRRALTNKLKESFSVDFDSQKRECIVELIGGIRDPADIPLLVQKLTFRPPGDIIGGMGRATFEAEHPYASGLVDYGKDALPALLSAVEKTSDPKVEEVATRVVDFMDRPIIFALIDQYVVTPVESRSSIFLEKSLLRLDTKPALQAELKARLSEAMDSPKRDSLQHLLAKIKSR